jgi:5'-nucleotidase
MITDKIALFDMDGTLADYELSLRQHLESICSPGESVPEDIFRDQTEEYMERRIGLIKNQPNWWLNLPAMQSGFDLLNVAMNIGFEIHVLTNGPKSRPTAWEQKVAWCKKYMPDCVKITITQEKSLVYGRVLVDDYSRYVNNWLNQRPRGLAIMPLHTTNKNYSRPNVIHYDGTNLEEVRKAMQKAFDRKSGSIG